ncbi:MAG: hypothetical protein JOZ41_22660 [Chloroflexi bacterium]|nr:hypothetical protein [Chloroflexota bacterium]
MKDTDTHVTKVTVSIPSYLYDWGEEERTRRYLSRSAFVANLYRRYCDELEAERRAARYAAAHAQLPETPEEQVLTVASMDLLATEPS